MTEPHQRAVFAAAIAVAAACAFFDWRKGEIPNWLTYAALVVAPLGHAARYLAAHETMETALFEGAYSVGGALVCSIVPLMLFRKGAMGGGDVKMLAATGAMLQTVMGVEAEMYAFFAATIAAPAKLAYEGKLWTTLKNAFSIGANFFLPKDRQKSVDGTTLSSFRLGPAVLFGVCFTAYLHW